MIISDRAIIILKIINEATIRNNEGELQRFFVPDKYQNWLDGKGYRISDSGDASILRSLVKKGFIEPIRWDCYFFAITENGKRFLSNNTTKIQKNDI